MQDEEAALEALRQAIQIVEDDCWRWCNPCKAHIDNRCGGALAAVCPLGEKCQHKPKPIWSNRRANQEG